MPKPTKRILSGVQPTGNLHLGNYLGALRNWVRLQAEYECFYCLVDLHAITVQQDAAALRASTRDGAAMLLAMGVDPSKSVLFVQSNVPAHAELGWIFNCVARIGWLNRMTQFKEKAGKKKENATVGLYVYPTLMAADILVYLATHVPVGDDQRQHLELCRDIAQSFNSQCGVEYFPLPEALILGEATRVMSLRDGQKKMSKSDESDYTRINMSDSPDLIAQKIRKARTDPEPLPGDPKGLESRPEAKNLVGIFAALADRAPADVLKDYGGAQFSKFKEDLAELAIAKVGPITTEMRRLQGDPGHVERVLHEGAERARAVADPIVRDVKEIVGFLRA
ncbi:MAG: tryptophan--tRNA ligase [Alphaproteobacteria bacterium]|nr:tryptophan--tRNA ligase [Alphaproteobacteria bacterium]